MSKETSKYETKSFDSLNVLCRIFLKCSYNILDRTVPVAHDPDNDGDCEKLCICSEVSTK